MPARDRGVKLSQIELYYSVLMPGKTTEEKVITIYVSSKRELSIRESLLSRFTGCFTVSEYQLILSLI